MMMTKECETIEKKDKKINVVCYAFLRSDKWALLRC